MSLILVLANAFVGGFCLSMTFVNFITFPDRAAPWLVPAVGTGMSVLVVLKFLIGGA